MITLGNLLTIAVLIFGIGGWYFNTNAKLKFLTGRMIYWFGDGNSDGKGNQHEEGQGILLLKLYIQKGLNKIDKKYSEKFDSFEDRLKHVEKKLGVVKKSKNGNGHKNGNESKNGNGVKNGKL